MGAVLIPIVIILVVNFGVFFIVYYAVKTRNTERLALIEKGMEPSLAEAKPGNRNNSTLRSGMFIVGLAIGIIIGYLLTLLVPIQPFVSYPAMILLFGGLALILYYVIELKRKENA